MRRFDCGVCLHTRDEERVKGHMQGTYKIRSASAEDASQEGFLEMLWRRVGCMYMSDLHVQPWNSTAIALGALTEPERFSLWEWNDAAEYLLGDNTKYADAQSALERFRLAAAIKARCTQEYDGRV